MRIGDSLYKKGLSKYSEKYYRKIVNEFPQYWYIYNKYEMMSREKGKKIINLENVFKQFTLMIGNFESVFIFFSIISTSFFFVLSTVLFILGLLFFIKYFKLLSNDIFFSGKGRLNYVNILMVAIFIGWPVLLKVSWVIYPFILIGLIMVYTNKKEKQALFAVWIIFLISIFGFNLNQMLEKRIQDKEFKNVQLVFNNKKFSEDEIENFSEELKVIQAYVFYKNHEYNEALNVLNMSNDSYTSKLKLDLLGNINYNFNNFNESLSFFTRSLEINDKDPVILNNLALILLRESDINVYQSYELRFPRIKKLKDKVSKLMEPELEKRYFWESLFNFTPNSSFDLGRSIKNVFLNFAKIPLLYFILISFMYYSFFLFLIRRYGDSVTCSKCNKILKKSKIHRSYDICDDCYQLFFIKDVIFLEAKAIKSRELEKKAKKRYVWILLVSILIPGFSFYTRKKYKIFTAFLTVFLFLLTVTAWSNAVFKELFMLIPLIINVLGILSLLTYLLINLVSIVGDNNGV
jgi:tetratricopeptide (TPR) repeat protein